MVGDERGKSRAMFRLSRGNDEFRIVDLQSVRIRASVDGCLDLQELREVIDGRTVLLLDLVHADHRRRSERERESEGGRDSHLFAF